MASLKNLSGAQLEKMLAHAKSEIKRREKIEIATKDIHSVLKRHRLEIEDIDLRALSKTTKRPSRKGAKSKTKNQDDRRRVKAKYTSPDGSHSWSGRGRAPAWVVELCKNKGINLTTFKADPLFRIS